MGEIVYWISNADRVLFALHNRGPMTVHDIAEALGVRQEIVRQALYDLESKRKVRETGNKIAGNGTKPRAEWEAIT